MRSFVQDLHYALRQLRNHPVFALTAIFTLALGIGVNAAMFSVIDQVLLHRMPFPRAGEVVQMAVELPNGTLAANSLPDIQDYQARSHSFQQIAYFAEQVPTLGGVANPKLVPQIVSSANLFDMLQVRPSLGRGYLPVDATAGHSDVVILSSSVWSEMYHADQQIIGRSVPINGVPHTVIGVMPKGFAFPVNTGEDSIWTPLPNQDKASEDRGSSAFSVIARLRPGVPITDAAHEMNSIHDQLKHEYSKDEDPAPIVVKPYQDVVTGAIRPAILALDIAVLAVWMIACANVAGLLLARGNGRRREVALRTALGAGRGRLIRQFFTENLLLSFAGGALGLIFAAFALRLLKQYLDGAIVFGSQVHIDLRVGAYLFAASCVSALLFGLLPALHASSVPPQEGLRQGTLSGGTSPRQTFSRDALVVGEIALTLTLLVAAGLMVRTLSSLRETHLGFVSDHVTTGQIYLPNRSAFFLGQPASQDAAKDGPNLIQTFYTPFLAQLRAQPGFQSVGLTTVRPLEGNWDFDMNVQINGQPVPERSSQSSAQARATTADYFQTMGIRLLSGRFFAATDAATAQPVVIVNHAFIQRFLPGGNPLGQQVRFNEKGPRQWATIVGVVDDSPQKTLGQAPLPEMDFNLEQFIPQDDLYSVLGTFFMNVAVRSTLDTETVARAIQRSVHDLEPDAALDNVNSMQDVVDSSLGSQVLAARLLGLFALTGLAIAMAGIYGLLAFTVSQRTRELGVRIALGAQREAVLWLILRHALVLLGAGIVIGALLSAAANKSIASFLPYKLSTDDGIVLLIVSALLILSGIIASFLPARRASLIDPVVALRTD